MHKPTRYLLLVLLLLVLAPVRMRKGPDDRSFEGKHLTCVIDLQGYRSRTLSYPVGYNYEMLRCFAREQHCGLEIILAEPEDSIADYLAIDSIMLVVRPAADSTGGYPSKALADSSCWVTRDARTRRAVNRWLTNFGFSEESVRVRERFTPSYEPYRRAASGKSYTLAGPYDELVRKYAANLGWDWHLLEAVVWQESQFRIEARSPRGALGLMQMMPSTARKYGVDDMLDPEENLRAGVEYLAKLQRMFDGRVAPEDLPRFTLAAYNAGEGRILDCIRMAQTLGMPHQTWQDIVEVIPHMREEAGVGADTVLQLGYFKGYETLAYIRLTDSLSRAFRCIVP